MVYLSLFVRLIGGGLGGLATVVVHTPPESYTLVINEVQYSSVDGCSVAEAFVHILAFGCRN